MAYLYPYGDTQQLNLSWFLAKFKELYEYILNLDPDDIAISAVLSRFTNEYDSSINYIPGDYAIHEGYIYKANQTTTGEFDPEAWDAALPVNDIQGLRILLGGLSTDLNELQDSITADNAWNNFLSPLFDGNTNFFNSSESTNGYYINSAGAEVARSGLNITGYIPTTPKAIILMNYCLGSSNYCYAFYDKNKKFLSAVPVNASNDYITTPDNAFYFRTSYTDSVAPTTIYVITEDKFKTNYLKKYYLQPEGRTINGKKYAAFPDMQNFNGKQIIAVRVANAHLPTLGDEGEIVLFEIEHNEVKQIKTFNNSDFGSSYDLRDPSLTLINNGKNLLLSMFTTNPADTATHENIIAVLDADYNILNYLKIPNLEGVIWNKALITPSGKLLIGAYSETAIYVCTSNEVFDGLSVSSLTFIQTVIQQTTVLNELSFAYVGKYLVCVARRTVSGAMIKKTENLEGTSGWNNAISLGHGLHAPKIIKFADSIYFLVAGAYRYNASSTTRQPAIFLVNAETNELVDYKILNNSDTYGSYIGIEQISDYDYIVAYYEDTNGRLTTELVIQEINILELFPIIGKILTEHKITEISDGGTGATTALSAKQNLGLGMMNSDILQIDRETDTTINIASNARGILIIIGSVPDIISLSTTSAGVVQYKSLLEPTEFTYSTATGQFIVTNSTTANFICAWIDFNNRVYSKQV